MEIKIKAIGFNKGTIGWLKDQLESGKGNLVEGIVKDSHQHGLWFKSDDISQYLAAFDVYDTKEITFGRYDISGDHYRDLIWTDAAWGILMDIAQQWCDGMNNVRENDTIDGWKPVMQRVEIRDQ